MSWNPSKHPRDARGRFTRKAGAGGGLAIIVLVGLYVLGQLLTAPSDGQSPRPSASATVSLEQLVRLGQDLRADREFGQQTVEEAAKLAHISEERLVAIEDGAASAPTVDELRQLAHVYALPQDLLEKRMTDAGHASAQ
ncbi:helix-turn-helix domain-containing protein [Microbispora sp. H13382]|uniref:helix-turn-helix domain-containing protein n=1 Tax=Microbispora sp. H13382 TaxID=2729112 RepID=UPI0016023CBC|nr:helix-turn-helix domain-containing protein [Microbispora sp. H13382]